MVQEKSAKRNYSAPALSKGLDILELMASQAEGLSLKEICDLLGRQKSELFRMLVVLEERGYVRHAADSDKYEMTSQLLWLAHQHPTIRRLSSIAEPYLRELANRCEQSCHLVIERASSGIVIAQKDSPTDRRFGVRIGAKLPLQNSCSGHVLLSFADEMTRKAMLEGIPASKHLSPAVLDEIVMNVRAQGYQSMESRVIAGVRDVSFPIFDYTGRNVAAINIPFLACIDNSQPLNFDEAREVLRDVTIRLSKELGWAPPEAND